MALTANANGVVSGKFTIPANVTSGSKAVEFFGSGGSHGSATFFGEGTLIENLMQRVITNTTAYYDPLAQTFFLNEMRQLIGVELYVEKKGDTPIVVHIRETANGYPAQAILGEAVLQPSGIVAGQWNRWVFPSPITIPSGVEYAVVVMCNDAVAEIGIAEMGKWGLDSQRWVTSQQPNVGVLFSSSNNSTWTAHQDKDMALRLLAAKYSQAERIIDLGTVPSAAHTDALLFSTSETPTAGNSLSLNMELPDGSETKAGDSQVVQMIPAQTGNIGLSAKLTATEKVSTILYPGTQIILGTVQPTGDYVSRAFDADAAESHVRVTYDANLPSGSTVKVFTSGAETPSVWEEVPQTGAARPIGDGFYEFQHYHENFNKARCKVKLVLTGTNSARPVVMNLRVSVTGTEV